MNVALAQRNLQHQRNQVGLRRVGLSARGGRAGGVEVAQAGITQSVGLVKPRQHALHHQLRFAVRVGRLQRIVFHDGNAARLAVNRRRLTKTQNAEPGASTRREAGSDVLAELLSKYFSGSSTDSPASMNAAKCITALKRPPCENWFYASGIAGVGLNEVACCGNCLPAAFAEIVQHCHRVAHLQQPFGHHASDISSTPGDQNPHSFSSDNNSPSQ